MIDLEKQPIANPAGWAEIDRLRITARQADVMGRCLNDVQNYLTMIRPRSTERIAMLNAVNAALVSFVHVREETEADTAARAMLAALHAAVLRVQLANQEGDPILSAWLPDARAAIAAAEAAGITTTTEEDADAADRELTECRLLLGT